MADLTLEGCEPLTVDGGSHGVLVLHGFTGCPQSVRPLAEAFAGAGYAIEMPLLPGHGTNVDDLVATGWDDWSAAADEAFDKLAARSDRVLVAGLSMGGGLSLWLATRHAEIAGLVLVNPAIRLGDDAVGVVQAMLDEGEDRMPGIGGDIADPAAQEAGYTDTPLVPVLSLAAGLDSFRDDLGKVTTPLLLFTSVQDHVVPTSDSDEIAVSVGGPVERVALERSYHVATLDYDRDVINEKAVAFAGRVV
jgi:carboxylesterase